MKAMKILRYATMLVFILASIRIITGASDLTSTGTASAALLLSVPIVLAALGGLFSERAGVVNIGLEGMMIMGAWAGGYIGSQHGPWAGLFGAVVFGSLGALVHAIATVTFGVDHVVSGVANQYYCCRISSIPIYAFVSRWIMAWSITISRNRNYFTEWFTYLVRWSVLWMEEPGYFGCNR